MNDDFEYNWSLQSKILMIETNAQKEETKCSTRCNPTFHIYDFINTLVIEFML